MLRVELGPKEAAEGTCILARCRKAGKCGEESYCLHCCMALSKRWWERMGHVHYRGGGTGMAWPGRGMLSSVQRSIVKVVAQPGGCSGRVCHIRLAAAPVSFTTNLQAL